MKPTMSTIVNASEYFDESDNEYRRPIITRSFRSSWDMYDRPLLRRRRLSSAHPALRTGRRNFLGRRFTIDLQTLQRQSGGKRRFSTQAEAHLGRSLGRLFDQWFATAGYPDIEVKFDYDTKKKQATFTIDQKQCECTFAFAQYRSRLDNRRQREPLPDQA